MKPPVRPFSRIPLSRVQGLLFGAILALSSAGLAQNSLPGSELRVCAEENNFPASSRDRGGYDVRIAELLAEAVGADLEMVWTGAQGQYVVETYLLTAECDLMMSVTEGASGLMNTIAYYSSPYVFVKRADSDFEVGSLDDEELRSLRISTYPNSIPHRALINRGMGEQIVFYRPVAQARGPDRDIPILEAVANGDVDIAILYGPVAGYYAKHGLEVIEITPVLPQIDAPMLQMFRILTMGVRPGAEALRDALNVALAMRWEEVQAVFEEYGVPVSPLSPPSAFGQDQGVLSIGVILPLPTVLAQETDSAADAARVGARLAENVAAFGAFEGHTVRLRFDSAPTAAAAARLAVRLIEFEGVSALVGGLGDGQAEALREIADFYDVPFLNIGSTSDALRSEFCSPNMFHIEASSAMYLDALAIWYSQEGPSNWFLVAEGSATGERLSDRAIKAIKQADAENVVIGTAFIPEGSINQAEALAQVRESNAERVLLIVQPVQQELFLSQLQHEVSERIVISLVSPHGQTREALLRRRQATGNLTVGPHIALWDASLEGVEAVELIQRFASRSGLPMDPTGWAAYAAVKIIGDSAVGASSADAEEIADYMRSSEAVFELSKGIPLSFRVSDNQLLQPLYAVSIDTEAEWGLELAGRIELGRVVGQVPSSEALDADPEPQLNLLGGGWDNSACD